MCGIIGVQGITNGNSPNSYIAAPDTYIGLCNLQHRGQSGAGMVVQSNTRNFTRIAGNGEIPAAFDGYKMSEIPGSTAVGQCRYPTTGQIIDLNTQPIEGEFRGHKFYLVHNGNLVNLSELTAQIGCNLPNGCSDTFLISQLISASRKKTMKQALIDVINRLRGSFNIIILYRNHLYAIKDRFGFHPLQIGQSDQAVVIASESCAFKTIGAKLVGDINPGEMVIVSPQGSVQSLRWTREIHFRIDVFEYIYFCRPDSVIHGVLVSNARKSMGRMLAERHNLPIDTIAPIPDSGMQCAWGFYQQSLQMGRSVEYLPDGIIRPHIAGGRTFIEAVRDLKEYRIRMKYQEQEELISGKRTGWADDSVVRGSTIKAYTKKARLAGAQEVHYIISSPPYCYRELYGIDTYRPGEMLLAWEGDNDPTRMARIAEADSLNYLSLPDTKRAIIRVAKPGSLLTVDSFHSAPFDGIYADGMGDYAQQAA